MKPVVFSVQAEAELEEIRAYIAAEAGPRRAEAHVNAIIEVAARLGDMPFAFKRRDDLEPGLRQTSHKKHLIFYKVGDERVEVLRILHGARDLPSLFGRP